VLGMWPHHKYDEVVAGTEIISDRPEAVRQMSLLLGGILAASSDTSGSGASSKLPGTHSSHVFIIQHIVTSLQCRTSVARA